MRLGSLIRTVLFLNMLGGCTLSQIEEPKYEVIKKYEDFELRKYQPTVVAETEVIGEFSASASIGFRRLANYIFGSNKTKTQIKMTAPVSTEAPQPTSEKINMTAPVSQVAAGSDRWVISFTMPSNYSLETLPDPLDPQVRLRAVPASTFAAIRFSGFNSATLVEEKTKTLRDMATKAGVALSDRVIYARYNPPWTLWFLRRNEILIEAKQ